MPAASKKRKQDNATPGTKTPSKHQKRRKTHTPPNIAVQSDETPNVFLGSDEDPMQHLVVHEDESTTDPKVIAHKNLFYETIIRQYKTTNNRAFVSRRERDGLIQMIKGDLSDTRANAYKLKRDFAVLAFGDHYSLVLRKDILGKEEADVSTVPRYCCYEDMFDAIRKCHIDQMLYPLYRLHLTAEVR
jgi:hypothetical protein